MENRKPLVVVLAGAFALNAADPRYSVQLFTDLPPTSAIAVGSVSTGSLYIPMYSTITDEPIAMPALEKNRVEQS